MVLTITKLLPWAGKARHVEDVPPMMIGGMEERRSNRWNVGSHPPSRGRLPTPSRRPSATGRRGTTKWLGRWRPGRRTLDVGSPLSSIGVDSWWDRTAGAARRSAGLFVCRGGAPRHAGAGQRHDGEAPTPSTTWRRAGRHDGLSAERLVRPGRRRARTRRAGSRSAPGELGQVGRELVGRGQAAAADEDGDRGDPRRSVRLSSRRT